MDAWRGIVGKVPKKTLLESLLHLVPKNQLLVPSGPSRLVKKSLRGTFSSPYTKKSLETNTPCMPRRERVAVAETLNGQ